MTVGIYFDEHSPLNRIEKLTQIKDQYVIYNQDIEGFLSSSHDKKIAAFYTPIAHRDWLANLNEVYDHVDHIFVFAIELQRQLIDKLLLLDRPKISIWIAGVINYQFEHATTHVWMSWITTCVDFYVNIQPTFLDEKLDRSLPKPKYFDVLLGTHKEHRGYTYQWIQDHNLTDKVVMAYTKNFGQELLIDSDFIEETDGVELFKGIVPVGSASPIVYYGNRTTIAEVVPLKVYNQTVYSIVAETEFNKHNTFTEKLTKPLLSKRLFIGIAGWHYLDNLKKLGFQTFDNVIDESYDNIVNNEDRWNAALEQLEWLTTQDQTKIYQAIKPALEHNYRQVTEIDWNNKFETELFAEVLKFFE